MNKVKVSTPILWLVGLFCLAGGSGLVWVLDHILDDYESRFLFRPMAVAGAWLVFAWYRHVHYRAVNWNSVAGIAVFIALGGYMGAEYLRIFNSARHKAGQANCTSNVKEIMLGVLQYTQDWDEKLPPAPRWATLAQTYVKQPSSAPVWHCLEATSPYSYAFNRELNGQPIGDVEDPPNTIMLFESDAAIWNATGDAQSRVTPGRHGEGSIYGLLDGHGKRYHDSVSGLRWLPRLSPAEQPLESGNVAPGK